MSLVQTGRDGLGPGQSDAWTPPKAIAIVTGDLYRTLDAVRAEFADFSLGALRGTLMDGRSFAIFVCPLGEPESAERMRGLEFSEVWRLHVPDPRAVLLALERRR